MKEKKFYDRLINNVWTNNQLPLNFLTQKTMKIVMFPVKN